MLRFLSILWAVVQLTTPALSGLVDARLVESAGNPVAHVEETSSAACPFVHPADCAICRYLSSAAPAPDGCDAAETTREHGGTLAASRQASPVLAVVLPDGRAPPTA